MSENTQPQTQQPQQPTINIDEIAKIKAENEALKTRLALLENTKQQPQTQEEPTANNQYEAYLKQKQEAETKKNNDDVLLKEFSNMSFLYNQNFIDAAERISRMQDFSLGDKIEQMAIDTILKAYNDDATRNKIKELKDVSVLDSKGAKNFLYLEAIKKLKNIAEMPTKAGGTADYNRLSTTELKALSAELFNGDTKEQAIQRAKNYGLL